MKNNFIKYFIMLIFAVCLATSGFAEHGGWHGGGGRHGGGGWHGGGGRHGGGDWHRGGSNSSIFFGIGTGFYPYYPNDGYGYRTCGWVRGHYDPYGYWIPSHRACW